MPCVPCVPLFTPFLIIPAGSATGTLAVINPAFFFDSSLVQFCHSSISTPFGLIVWPVQSLHLLFFPAALYHNQVTTNSTHNSANFDEHISFFALPYDRGFFSEARSPLRQPILAIHKHSLKTQRRPFTKCVGSMEKRPSSSSS